ncbi:unnamed protein product [Oppiella nova]|uniref:Amino acid transporter n=1 Tax=Oppiella nova TaxID=334625 RepID=A0A7R9LMP6_9ACAR|nr:unnamed protein product [Oppiella nova]CAG2165176.1 unnamed protein product [Oppiella nova]
MTQNVLQISEPKLSETKYGTVEYDSRSRRSRVESFVRQNLLALATLSAVLVAIIVGIIIRSSTDKWSERHLMYLEFPGDIFLRMLKCLILPLIISSLISSLGNLDTKLSGHIGSRAVLYYLATTVLAIFLGIFLVLTIRPGYQSTVERSADGPKPRVTTTADTILDLIRNLFPTNLVEACFAQYSTTLMPIGNETDVYKWKIKGTSGGGTNILGLVVFSIVLGIIIGRMRGEGKPLLNFFTSLSEATLKITNIVIKFTPIGVMFLILPRIVSVDDVRALLSSVGLFALTVAIGLIIHGFIFLPLIYYFFVRKNPYIFLGKMTEALMTAFGTASSAATLPVTISCLEEKNKIDRNVVRFCVPIGATINMDGTALYEAVAALFITQSRGFDMDFAKVLIVSITATAASVGAAGIPQAGLITMVIVLNALGLPAEDVALVYIIDWLLDRLRTPINVLGDAYGSAIVEHLSRSELQEFSDRLNKQDIDDEKNNILSQPLPSSPSSSAVSSLKSINYKESKDSMSYNNSAFIADANPNNNS